MRMVERFFVLGSWMDQLTGLVSVKYRDDTFLAIMIECLLTIGDHQLFYETIQWS